MCPQISAKELLEYNHKDGDVTVVFCVPKKEMHRIGKEVVDDKFHAGYRMLDLYLRRSISCIQQEKSFEYVSEYFYPTEGILFAFDRDNILVKFNKNYKETYYLDKHVKGKQSIFDGQLFSALKNANNSFEK